MTTPAESHLHSRLNVAVSSISFSKNLSLRSKLKQTFQNSIFNETGGNLSEDELITFLENKDAAIVGIEPITDKVLSQSPQLKIISKYGSTLTQVDNKILIITFHPCVEAYLKKKNIQSVASFHFCKKEISTSTCSFLQK